MRNVIHSFMLVAVGLLQIVIFASMFMGAEDDARASRASETAMRHVVVRECDAHFAKGIVRHITFPVHLGTAWRSAAHTTPHADHDASRSHRRARPLRSRVGRCRAGRTSCCSATAVCIYDAVEEAGALLHLRFIIRSAKPADVTDTTLATELLLLDRCIESLREAVPGAKNLQAKIAAHLPENPDAQRACDSVLTLVRHFLDDSGMTVVTSDVAGGADARVLRFRPSMGWLQIS